MLTRYKQKWWGSSLWTVEKGRTNWGCSSGDTWEGWGRWWIMLWCAVAWSLRRCRLLANPNPNKLSEERIIIDHSKVWDPRWGMVHLLSRLDLLEVPHYPTMLLKIKCTFNALMWLGFSLMSTNHVITWLPVLWPEFMFMLLSLAVPEIILIWVTYAATWDYCGDQV